MRGLEWFIPNQSNYPLSYLHIRETKIVPSNKQGVLRVCANCGSEFHDGIGKYRYTINPAKYEIGVGQYFHFDNYVKRSPSHFCSKECLAEYAADFAEDSVTEEGKKYIKMDKIRNDIDQIISKFH